MVVGLSTVFCVLGIVVATGKVLIRVSNAFQPALAHTEATSTLSPSGDLSGVKIAAITGAVHAITGGKGQITQIERPKE